MPQLKQLKFDLVVMSAYVGVLAQTNVGCGVGSRGGDVFRRFDSIVLGTVWLILPIFIAWSVDVCSGEHMHCARPYT